MQTYPDDFPATAIAAALEDGNLRVLGAPGSGKTTLAIEMFAALAARDGVDAVRVITATRQAATRLRDELSFRAKQPSRGPLAKSVSALAFEVLSEARGADSPVRLLSGGEQDYDIRHLLAGEIEEGKADYWPTKLGPEVRELLEFRTQLRDLLSRCRDLDLISTDPNDRFGRLRELGERNGIPEWVAAAKFFANYIYRVRDSRPAQLDPTELMNEATAVLQDPNPNRHSVAPEAAANTPAQITLIVDDVHEFSPSQWRFIEAWSRSRGKIIVLGDPDLRIVGFKGTAQVLLDNNPTPPVSLWKQTLQLPIIHRQSGVMPTVLGQIVGATRVAGDTETRAAYPAVDEIDFAAARAATGFELKTGLAFSAQGERQLVAQYLRAAIGSGVAPNECAVLVRNGAAAEAIVEYLGSASIPAFTETTGSPLRDHPAVWALLTIVSVGNGLNELTPDITSRILHGPFGGVTSIEYRRFRRALRKAELGSGGNRFADELMLEAINTPGVLDGIVYDVPKSVKWLARTLAKLRESTETSVDEMLWEVWNSSKKAEEWTAVSALGGADSAWANESLDAVLALFGVAANALENDPGETVNTFMHRILGQTVPNDSLTPRFTSGAVFVGTPTAAAGIEFDTVVVAGLNEGVWPNTRTRSSLLSANRLADAAFGNLIKLPEEGNPARIKAIAERYKTDHLEVLRDEVRLFLIGMSRARRATMVTAVTSEEESPSPLFTMIAGEKGEEEKTASTEPAANAFGSVFSAVEIVGSLPQLVGSLRADLLKEHTEPAAKTRAALLLKELADRGVRGADPSDWLGMRAGSPEPLFNNTDIRISPSGIQDFEESALDWFVEQVSGGESGIPASIGTMVHGALEQHPSGSRAELTEAVMEHWGDLGLDASWIDQRWRNKLDGMIIGLADYVAKAKADGRTVIAKEQFFTATLELPDSANKIVVSGSIDRIEQTNNDTILIIDFKTGEPKNVSKDKLAENRQLQSYQLAYRIGELSNRSGETAPRGLAVAGAALVHPRPETKTKTFQEYPQAAMTDEQFADFKQHLIEVALTMNATSFSGPLEVDDYSGDNVFKKKLFRTTEVSSDE